MTRNALAAGLLAIALAFGFVAAPAFSAEAKKATEKKEETKAGKDAKTNEIVERGWAVRCPETKDAKADKKQCEVFQRIDMKGADARVAELAIGFPTDKDIEKGGAFGAVVLPLGILLDQGVVMKVEEVKKPSSFKVRYCTNAGCVSYVNIGKSLLESMKKAKTVTFAFKTMEGQDVNLIMSLTGLETALKEIQ